MAETNTSQTIAAELSNELLSSSQVFSWAVHEVIERVVLREVVGEKINFTQLKLLYLVAHTDALNMSDAAAFLGVTSAAVTRIVDKLVRHRLLRRNAPQDDRRTIRLSLTEGSRRLMCAYKIARNHRAKAAFSQFSAEELRTISELLDRLAAAVVGIGAEPDAICMQCEMYYRDPCRFGDLGQRNCFFQRHRTPPEDNCGEGRQTHGDGE